MIKYEYRTVVLQFEKKAFAATRSGVLQGLSAKSAKEMNELGDEGWELVSALPYVMGESVLVRHPGTDVAFAFFKRPRT